MALGHEPKAVTSTPPPEYAAESSRVTIKIKFKFCEVSAPASAQAFDNTQYGGSATDAFVIYKLIGTQSWAISAPFVPSDPSCWIKYTLVLKGTDTDSATNWPEITLIDGQNDGNVKL